MGSRDKNGARKCVKCWHTLGNMLQWHEAGTSPSVCTTWDACCRHSSQARAHEADWGIKFAEITEGAWKQTSVAHFYWFVLFSSRDSLQEQYTQSNIEIGVILPPLHEFKPAEFHAKCCGDKFCLPKGDFAKMGMSHEKTVAAMRIRPVVFSSKDNSSTRGLKGSPRILASGADGLNSAWAKT